MVQFSWLCFLLAIVSAVVGYPRLFEKSKFKVGIEYENSLPMYGGSDRFRHRNNYDPFFVTVSATAKSGFVISYIEVSATVDASGELDFHVVRGQTGSKTLTFQLVSNHSDFLSYNYLAYGIREDEYRKISNIITLPLTNNGLRQQNSFYMIILLIFFTTYSFVVTLIQ